MRIRTLSIGAILAASIAAGAGAQSALPSNAPFDSAKVESIEQLLAISGGETAYQAQLDAMLAAQSKMMPAGAGFMTGMQAFIRKYLTYSQIKPGLIRAYRETFTEADCQTLLRMYQSPEGKHVLERMPVLTVKMNEMSKAIITAHGAELVQMIMQQGQGAGPQ